MDNEKLDLLKRISDIGEPVSIYSLIEDILRQEDKEKIEIITAAFDKVVGAVFYLVGIGFLQMKIVKGENGEETFVTTTPNGRRYLEAREMMGE